MSTADLLKCHDLLLRELTEAMSEREQRDGTAPSIDQYGKPTSELAWIVHERDVMAAATDKLRADRGLEPANRTDLVRVESLATGHSDYASKFALYCAEYAAGLK